MQFLDPLLEKYASDHSSPEPIHLKELADRTRKEVPIPQMLSGHLQGRFLSMLSHLVNPSCVLDIGTYTGYSALCLAEGLAPGGKVHTIDIDRSLETMIREHLDMSGIGSRIELHFGDARSLIPTIDGPYDLVFIDADKENYVAYFDLVIDRIRPGGLVIADNVLWSGKVAEPASTHDAETQGLRAYAEKVNGDPRVSNVLVPLRDGLLISRRN